MIDTHCHLDDRKFSGELEDVIQNAKNRGLSKIITSASSFSSNQKALDISRKYKGFVYPCLGLYPGNCIKEGKTDSAIDFILEHRHELVAIGEIGLDYYWFKTEEGKKIQIDSFKKFIELGLELGLPLIVHSRNAEDDVIKMLEKQSAEKALLHCFTGTIEQAAEAIDRGYMLGMSTRMCFTQGSTDLVKSIPIENILCETDSPYNQPLRKGRNEPMFVKEAIELVADAKELSFEETDSILDKNAEKFFRFY